MSEFFNRRDEAPKPPPEDTQQERQGQGDASPESEIEIVTPEANAVSASVQAPDSSRPNYSWNPSRIKARGQIASLRERLEAEGIEWVDTPTPEWEADTIRKLRASGNNILVTELRGAIRQDAALCPANGP